MLSTKGVKPIVLHTGDYQLTYQFGAKKNTSNTAGDGTIPYGRSVSSVNITTTNYSGGTSVTDLVDSSSIDNDVVIKGDIYDVINIIMSYTSAADRIKLVCIMTLDSGSKIEWATNNIYCEAN